MNSRARLFTVAAILLSGFSCVLTPADASAAVIPLATHTGILPYDTAGFATGGSASGAHTPFALAPGSTNSQFAANNIGVIGVGNVDGVALQAGPPSGVLTLTLPTSVSASQFLTIWEAGLTADPFNLKVSIDNGMTYSPAISFTATAVTPVSGVGSPESPLNSVFAPMSSFSTYIGAGVVNKIEISRTTVGDPDIVAVSSLAAVPEPTSFGVVVGLLGFGLYLARRRHGA